MGKYGKLMKNSIVFAVGNAGSYIISFFFVRLYTEVMTTDQYGVVDVIVTTVAVITPIITLAIVESVLRFSMDGTDNSAVLNNGIIVTMVGTAFFCVAGPIIFSFTDYMQYFVYIITLVFFQGLDNICAQYIRGIGKVTIYALSGIIRTITLVLSNVVFLVLLNMRIEGYLLSIAMSEIITILYTIISSGAYRVLNLRFEPCLLRKMLKYSLPLIPNSLSWWIMDALDKYVIMFFLGASFNGIYAVAHKIPSIINTCNNLFFQAWQISAVEESGSENQEQFFSTIFNMLSMVLFIITAVLFIALKTITRIIASDNYLDAWKYSPFLILSMVFSSFAGFLGTNYHVSKMTKGSLKTTFVGAIVNIVLNLFLIKKLGLNGAAVATMISYFVVWIYRVIDTRKIVRITYKSAKLVVSVMLLILQAILLTFEYDYCTLSGLFVLVLLTIVYKKEVCLIVSIMIKRIRGKR